MAIFTDAYVLHLNNLSKCHQCSYTYKDLNLSFDTGIHVLKGPNGCGKSTLINILAGIDNDYTGLIRYYKNQSQTPYRFAQLGSYVPDKPEIYPFWKGQDFLSFICRIKKLSDYDNLHSIINRLGLNPFLTTKFSNMSLGTIKKFFITAAMVKTGDILLMDEPTISLDQSAIDTVASMLNQLQEDHIVILSSHNQDFINQLQGCHIIGINSTHKQNLSVNGV